MAQPTEAQEAAFDKVVSEHPGTNFAARIEVGRLAQLLRQLGPDGVKQFVRFLHEAFDEFELALVKRDGTVIPFTSANGGAEQKE
jgi:hypothetical protein